MEEKITAKINGEIKECDILFTFDCDELSKTYIGYTDNSKNEKNETNIYVCSIKYLDGEKIVEEIKEPEEIKMVNEVIVNLTNS